MFTIATHFIDANETGLTKMQRIFIIVLDQREIPEGA